jgi:hypothetical protein
MWGINFTATKGRLRGLNSLIFRFPYLAKFLTGTPPKESDKTDRTAESEVLSVLSVNSEGVSRLEQSEETFLKDGNLLKRLKTIGDKTDKTISSCRECPHYLPKAVNPDYPAWCMFWEDVLLENNPECLAKREGKTLEKPPCCLKCGGVVFIPDPKGQRLCAICDRGKLCEIYPGLGINTKN